MNPSLRALAAFAAPTAALLAPALLAAPIPAESRLVAATVYPDRAVVTRTASGLAIPAGTTEIIFADLPASLQDESVQVSAHGSVSASLLDVATRTVFVAAEPDARAKELEDRLLDLRRAERVLKDQASLLDAQRALLANIEKTSTAPVAPIPGATIPPRPSLEDYAKLLDFSADQRNRIEASARSLDIERSALTEKIAATEAQLNELRGRQPARRATKTVTVRLATTAAGKLDLALAYTLPGASWTPAYDARLRSEKRQVRLDAFGLVRNATGEDWADVALTLSTARPSLGGAAPEIAPWYVDVSQPIAYRRVSGSMLNLDSKIERAKSTLAAAPAAMSAVAYDAAPAEQEVAATFASAVVASAATSASFKIATPVTLPSDNTPQRVPLGGADLAAVLRYQATPKLQETAFLAAAVTNTGELPFLGGALNVFLDDTFVATSRLATTMPGEKFTLQLGADEGIALKRKVVARYTEDTGLTTRSRRTTYDILLTVTNNKRSVERIVLTDALPVSRDEKIVVKLLAPAEREFLKPEDSAAETPRVGLTRDSDGRLTWCLDLKAGEKRELAIKFSIEHPTNLGVSGIE